MTENLTLIVLASAVGVIAIGLCFLCVCAGLSLFRESK